MTVQQADASINETVRYKGGLYELSALIKRKDKRSGRVYAQVELLDIQHGNSVVYARPEMVEEVREIEAAR